MNTKQAKHWYKRWWVWIIIITLLIAVGNAVGGNKSDTATNGGNIPQSFSQLP